MCVSVSASPSDAEGGFDFFFDGARDVLLRTGGCTATWASWAATERERADGERMT
jgi:hypothetical protein